MADFATPVAVPQELAFTNLPATLPDSKTYQFRVSPNGIGTGSVSLGSGTTIQFPIPAIPRGFWQCKSAYITGRATFTVATQTAGTDLDVILGSAYSAFSNWALRSANGSSIDNIANPGILATALLALGTDLAGKIAYSNNLLTSASASTLATTLGLQFNQAATKAGQNLVLDFAIPILGAFQCNNYIPAFYEMLLELTVNTVANFAKPTGAGSISTCALSNLEFVSEVIELTPASFEWLKHNTFPNGQINLKTETYSYCSSSLSASSAAGTYDLPMTVRCKSMKRLFITVCPSNAFDAPVCSVNPNANSVALMINGQSIPSRALQLTKPADCYAYLMNAMGGFVNPDKCGSISLNSFRSASTAYVASVYEAYGTAYADMEQSNYHPIIINCEQLDADSPVLFNGVNTSGSTSNIVRFDINTAISAYVHTVNMFANYDAIWNFDLNTNTTTLYY